MNRKQETSFFSTQLSWVNLLQNENLGYLDGKKRFCCLSLIADLYFSWVEWLFCWNYSRNNFIFKKECIKYFQIKRNGNVVPHIKHIYTVYIYNDQPPKIHAAQNEVKWQKMLFQIYTINLNIFMWPRLIMQTLKIYV